MMIHHFLQMSRKKRSASAWSSRHIGILTFGRVQQILLLRLRFGQKAPAKCTAEVFAVVITFCKLLGGGLIWGDDDDDDDDDVDDSDDDDDDDC